jgi:precorrin-4/cobalt-precorrin-4 C11-methyltransferase
VPVYFVGAGPGDPELLTIKGQRLLSQADVVIYTGSLINPDLLTYAKNGAEIYNSAAMTLEEIIHLILISAQKEKLVVRLHTGDPSLYGAIQEQIDALHANHIKCHIIPGVSSFSAAAAVLQREYTKPAIAQTLIITRMGGKTPVPEKEKLINLAQHQTSMCIFLSVNMMEDIIKELVAGGYPVCTPVAVVYKASWPEEIVVKGTLNNILSRIKQDKIKKTALILVGDFLGDDQTRSCLYHPEFTHLYREGKKIE